MMGVGLEMGVVLNVNRWMMGVGLEVGDKWEINGGSNECQYIEDRGGARSRVEEWGVEVG